MSEWNNRLPGNGSLSLQLVGDQSEQSFFRAPLLSTLKLCCCCVRINMLITTTTARTNGALKLLRKQSRKQHQQGLGQENPASTKHTAALPRVAAAKPSQVLVMV